MIGQIGNWWRERRRRHRNNFAMLREVADKLGPEFEAESYERLINELDCSEGEVDWHGVQVRYTAASYNVKKNGDLCFCIDIHAELPTPFGRKPSYQFVKRPDGSVYH